MAEVESSNLSEPILRISDDILEGYLDILRLSGVTHRHIKEVRRALKSYQKYILSVIDKQKSIQFFSKLQRECSTSYYRKQMYQLKRFLKFLKVEWTDEISLPKEPVYNPMRISHKAIDDTILYFKDSPHFLQIKALILLGSSSGLRAEELYQLSQKDINLKMRKVNINHNPSNNQSTKNQKTRVSFFSKEAKTSIQEYYNFFRNGCGYSKLFPQTTLTRLFNSAPIRVKHLRKFFSQEWERRGGSSGIKKLLMGHSIRNDVDLNHYNFQSEEDLKQIYDRVFDSLKIT